MKTIKAVYKPNFSVALKETDTNEYVVQYSVDVTQVESEALSDLNTAMMMFDMKLEELENVWH